MLDGPRDSEEIVVRRIQRRLERYFVERERQMEAEAPKIERAPAVPVESENAGGTRIVSMGSEDIAASVEIRIPEPAVVLPPPPVVTPPPPVPQQPKEEAVPAVEDSMDVFTPPVEPEPVRVPPPPPPPPPPREKTVITKPRLAMKPKAPPVPTFEKKEAEPADFLQGMKESNSEISPPDERKNSENISSSLSPAANKSSSPPHSTPPKTLGSGVSVASKADSSIDAVLGVKKAKKNQPAQKSSVVPLIVFIMGLACAIGILALWFYMTGGSFSHINF